MLTRRQLPLAIAGLPAARSSGGVEVDPRIAKFHKAWDKFLRTYLGCPSGATRIDECDANKGLWDYPEFVKASKAGRELFALDKS